MMRVYLHIVFHQNKFGCFDVVFFMVIHGVFDALLGFSSNMFSEKRLTVTKVKKHLKARHLNASVHGHH